jgi:Ni,Fe-hydrogenase III large subunit
MQGWAERLPRLAFPEALHRAAQICSTSSVAHTLALCSAIEALCGLEVGKRAAALRGCAAELERLAAHLEAAQRVIWALGVQPVANTLANMAVAARQALVLLAGSSATPDLLKPGGVLRDLSLADRNMVLTTLPKLNRVLYQTIERLINSRPILRRTVDIGTLARSAAEQFGVRGPLARASGIARDVRVDQPYGIYRDLSVRAITQDGGDLYARLMVLLLEAYESLKLAEQLLRELPEADPPQKLDLTGIGPGIAQAEIESPHGPLRYRIEGDGNRLKRVDIQTPRQLDRLMIRTLLSGALVDNAVAIIASADHCPYCAEL